MSYFGYKGRALNKLKEFNAEIGNEIIIHADSTYTGILMPRYEYSDDDHLVIKLGSGYNIGLEIEKIKNIEIKSKKSTITSESTKQRTINKELPRILLISTGGTIASSIDYRTGAVKPALTAEELNANVPELAQIADIDTEVLLSEYSENLLPEHWKMIAKKLDSYANSQYNGIIIAHGTDTMQYTASALAFSLVGFPKSVVLVGSQRSSDRPSSDAALNLIAATKFLVNEHMPGFFVVMHNTSSDDEIACHWATRVRKNHTSKRNAFQTIGDSPAYIVKGDNITKNKKFSSIQKTYTPKIDFDTNAILVKYYPGMKPELIENLIRSGYKAIIFEGTGLGHVGKVMYEPIKTAIKNGIFIGMTSQCIDGMVRMTVYDSGRDLLNIGVVPLGNMIPETALVKTMWALANSKSNIEMTKVMTQNIALEISD